MREWMWGWVETLAVAFRPLTYHRLPPLSRGTRPRLIVEAGVDVGVGGDPCGRLSSYPLFELAEGDHPLHFRYSNRSATSCARCSTRSFFPWASTPPRRCMRQPGLSATRMVAPVLSALRSLLCSRRSATSPCSMEVEPPKPQHTSDWGISRSCRPSASWMMWRASLRRPRQLQDWQE